MTKKVRNVWCFGMEKESIKKEEKLPSEFGSLSEFFRWQNPEPKNNQDAV